MTGDPMKSRGVLTICRLEDEGDGGPPLPTCVCPTPTGACGQPAPMAFVLEIDGEESPPEFYCEGCAVIMRAAVNEVPPEGPAP